MRDLSEFGTLAEYNRKRRFDVTPEPRGGRRPSAGPRRRFVVQKYADLIAAMK